MTKEVIGTGETLILAQKNACEILGVGDEEVTFEVIQLPKKKIFGLFGGKNAVVKALLTLDPSALAVSYVRSVLTAFGATGFNIEVTQKDARTELLVKGGTANRMIGRRGDTLDAVQYLAGLVANNVSQDYRQITINIENYRERREKTLQMLGRKIGIKVLKTKQKIELEPMTPYERKVIHSAVGTIHGVESHSEGEGAKRHVVVAPLPKKKCLKTS